MILFSVDCTHCPGDGVRRPKRPGVDWPEPCNCGGRATVSEYQLGRLLAESPKTIVRLHEVRTGHGVSVRLHQKLHDFQQHGWRAPEARR